MNIVTLNSIPALSPQQKRAYLLNLARTFDLKVFVETGTYLGNTVSFMDSHFNRIISYELDIKLFQLNKTRFENKPHIKIVHGDSGVLLDRDISSISEPALFWLDGHFSGGFTAKGENYSPILKELLTIFNHDIKNHVIAIDDARDFLGFNGYPTINELVLFVGRHSNYMVRINDDIILITSSE